MRRRFVSCFRDSLPVQCANLLHQSPFVGPGQGCSGGGGGVTPLQGAKCRLQWHLQPTGGPPVCHLRRRWGMRGRAGQGAGVGGAHTGHRPSDPPKQCPCVACGGGGGGSRAPRGSSSSSTRARCPAAAGWRGPGLRRSTAQCRPRPAEREGRGTRGFRGGGGRRGGIVFCWALIWCRARGRGLSLKRASRLPRQGN